MHRSFTLAELFVFIIWLFFIAGWVGNIYGLVSDAGSVASISAITLMMLLQIIGIIVAPLGSIMGWMWMLS